MIPNPSALLTPELLNVNVFQDIGSPELSNVKVSRLYCYYVVSKVSESYCYYVVSKVSESYGYYVVSVTRCALSRSTTVWRLKYQSALRPRSCCLRGG